MVKLSKIQLNPELVASGVWFDYYAPGLEDEDPICCKIAHVGNPGYKQKLSKLMQAKGRGFRSRKTEDLAPIQKIAAAEFLLLDWKNVEDDNGKPIKYTPEEGLKVLNKPEYDDFWLFVISSATSAEEYRAEVKKDSAKNSRSSSTTG